jgi:hypothetical protein
MNIDEDQEISDDGGCGLSDAIEEYIRSTGIPRGKAGMNVDETQEVGEKNGWPQDTDGHDVADKGVDGGFRIENANAGMKSTTHLRHSLIPSSNPVRLPC